MINTTKPAPCDNRNGTYCCRRPKGHTGPHQADASSNYETVTAEWRDPYDGMRFRKTYGPTR